MTTSKVELAVAGSLGAMVFTGVGVGAGIAMADERACHSICVSPRWSIIGPPFGRTEGVFCDQGHRFDG
jgi:hypothetical protein